MLSVDSKFFLGNYLSLSLSHTLSTGIWLQATMETRCEEHKATNLEGISKKLMKEKVKKWCAIFEHSGNRHMEHTSKECTHKNDNMRTTRTPSVIRIYSLNTYVKRSVGVKVYIVRYGVRTV